MSEFLTVKKNDSTFAPLLWGSFSTAKRALPISTMNLGQEEETVTFEIVDKKNIVRPSWFKIFIQLIKFQNFFLVLIPFFYVIIKNYVDNQFYDAGSCALSLIAMLFLFAGLSIRNDVNDHISGYDRVNIAPKTKPIPQGWITAQQASLLSWLFIFVATVIAIPITFRQPEAGWVIMTAAFLIFAARLLSKNSYKNQRWGEIIFFILIGPGVVTGYQVSLGNGIDTEVLVFGVMWAWAIQFLVHLNNFSHLLTSSQAGIKNTMTDAGFDNAKKILIGWWILFITLWIIYHYFYASIYWSVLTTIVLIFWSTPTFIKISEIQSPIGSELHEIQRVGYRNFLLMSSLIIVEFYWYLGDKNRWFV